MSTEAIKAILQEHALQVAALNKVISDRHVEIATLSNAIQTLRGENIDLRVANDRLRMRQARDVTHASEPVKVEVKKITVRKK